jgi:DNA-directed RNA polymerase subunit RPC12/RpoP
METIITLLYVISGIVAFMLVCFVVLLFEAFMLKGYMKEYEPVKATHCMACGKDLDEPIELNESEYALCESCGKK